jgi:MoaA/NifB/PqqE/SkfB family radical SAM enzyme
MLTEEAHADGVADKLTEHEDAAHEKRNWVRLTYDCNNRCVFCLDSNTHDGEMRHRDEVKQQILDGRHKRATRLILSGGEPTIHPDYVDFIRLGRLAGYRKIQTVTNGRLFSYPEFLQRCVSAGLDEITFSLHGPNAKIHDALVGVRGAFDEELAGMRNALSDGRLIVNVDIVINRANVKHLADMLERFIGLGVREFDLLQVVPFGRAFTEGRDTLFYDLEEARPHLLRALEYSKRPDVHLWLNRFPPQHLEGYEHLIQDPYKLNDEVRGRKEEFALLLDQGIPLDCREPQRCHYCYLEKLCDSIDETRAELAERSFEVLRVDSESEARQEPTFGGDPASAKRARVAPPAQRSDGKVGLPLLGQWSAPLATPLEQLGAPTIWIVAPSLPAAQTVAQRFADAARFELELDDYTGLDGDRLDGRLVTRAVARTALQAEMLLALPASFEVALVLTRATATWLDARADKPARLVLVQPTWERLTEAREQDAPLEVLSRLARAWPTEGVPACIGNKPRRRPAVLDGAMLGANGRIEIHRFTQRYIRTRYFTKSLRCKECIHARDCDGLHVNYVRAHGYAAMQPVREGVTACDAAST